MRMTLWIVFLGASLLFLLENDQQTVIMKFPFWGQTSPLPVGVIVILAVILGICLCFFSGLLKKTRSRFGQLRNPSSSTSHQDTHHHE